MLDWNVIAICLSILGGLWAHSMWLGSQFSAVRKLVYDTKEQLLNLFTEKLEYHERHDDQRFMSITNDIWDLRVRNAGIDGKTIDLKKSLKNV